MKPWASIPYRASIPYSVMCTLALAGDNVNVCICLVPVFGHVTTNIVSLPPSIAGLFMSPVTRLKKTVSN